MKIPQPNGWGIFYNLNGNVTVEDGIYIRYGNSGQVVFNGTGSSFIMNNGSIINYNGTTDAIANGNIYIKGGTISAKRCAAVRIKAAGEVLEISGGTIKNSLYGVKVNTSQGSVRIGNVIFENNENDIYLNATDARIAIGDDFNDDNSTVALGKPLGEGEKRQITTTGTSISMKEKLIV